jgi:predicted PurR-regulated permease PerM
MEDAGAPAPTRPPETQLTLSFGRRVIFVLALVALTVLLLALVVLGIDILLAVFGGILLAILLRACTDLVKRYIPLSDRWAFTAVLFILLGLIGVGGTLLAPPVAEQAEELGQRIPEITQQIREYLQGRVWGRWILSRAPDMGGGAGQQQGQGQAQGAEQAEGGGDASGLAQAAVQGVGGLLGVLSTWATYGLVVLFVGLFTAANPALYRDGFLHLFPMRRRRRLATVLDRLGYTLRWWLIGQLFAMVMIGVSTTILLWLFDVPLAILLGLIVGLLGFIPYLGPILGLVPIVLIAATQDVSTLAYVVLAYTAVQMIEGYVATPLIQQGMVHVPPGSTIALQMLLGAVVGVLGIVFATPLAAVLLVLTHFYRTDILGDPEALKEDEEGGEGNGE